MLSHILHDTSLLHQRDLLQLSGVTLIPTEAVPPAYLMPILSPEAIKELKFLFEHLPIFYRNKIVGGNDFNKFVESLLYLNTSPVNQDEKTKNLTFRIASQLFLGSSAAIKDTLPNEFQNH